MSQALKTAKPAKPVNKPAKPAQASAKPQASKQAEKPAKPATINAYTACATFVESALAGKMGKALAGFYKSAEQYHAKRSTVFPRGKTAEARAEIASMSTDQTRAMLEMVAKAIMLSGAAGNRISQAVYDLYKVSK